MTRRKLLMALTLLLLLASGGGVRAEADADRVAASFAKFCNEWMSKLEARRLFNLKRAQDEEPGAEVVLRYLAYSTSPIRCEAKTRPDGSAIGRIVYQQLHMQKSGADRKHALENQPNELGRTEVMEIFRFDGSRWEY